MTSRRPLLRTRAAAVLATSLIGTTGIALVPAPARALASFEFERIAGPDRYATAAAIATTAFPTGADEVILATGQDFPDALAGNFLAGALGAPILLATPGDVPDATLEALDALDPDTVTLLGGTGVLGEGVAAELARLGHAVHRVAGADRFDTARLLAAQGAAGGVGLVDGKRTAVVTTGRNFPDALAIGPVSYDERFPILLTENAALSPSVPAAIDQLDIEHVIVLGGEAAVSGGVQAAIGGLGVSTERIGDATRFSTAAAIAERAIEDFGFVKSHIDLASGRHFPDALAGGALGGEETAPMLLSEPSVSAAETCAFLRAHVTTLEDGHVLGGLQAVSDDASQELRGCAGGAAPTPTPPNQPPTTPPNQPPFPPPPATTNQDFVGAPSAPVLAELAVGGVAQPYTFAGIPFGSTVDITFVPCFATTIDPDGVVSVHDDPVPADLFISILTGQEDDAVHRNGPNDYLGNGYASHYTAGNDNTVIELVNGLAPSDDYYVDDFVVGLGVLTVQYRSTGADCVVPLVFDDSANDDDLDVTPETNLPVDAFAVGGAFIASNGEAVNGQEIRGDVMYIDKGAGYVVLDDQSTPAVEGNVFYYDGADDYTADLDYPPFLTGTATISLATWELRLNPLDRIDDDGAPGAVYSRAAANDFELDDDYANHATGTTVVMGDFDDDPGDSAPNDARVTWQGPDPELGYIVDYEADLYLANGTVFGFFAGFDSDDDPQPITIPEANQDLDGDLIDDDVDNTLILEDLPLGDYVIVIQALTASGDGALFGSEPSNVVSSPG